MKSLEVLFQQLTSAATGCLFDDIIMTVGNVQRAGIHTCILLRLTRMLEYDPLECTDYNPKQGTEAIHELIKYKFAHYLIILVRTVNILFFVKESGNKDVQECHDQRKNCTNYLKVGS